MIMNGDNDEREQTLQTKDIENSEERELHLAHLQVLTKRKQFALRQYDALKWDANRRCELWRELKLSLIITEFFEWNGTGGSNVTIYTKLKMTASLSLS